MDSFLQSIHVSSSVTVRSQNGSYWQRTDEAKDKWSIDPLNSRPLVGAGPIGNTVERIHYTKYLLSERSIISNKSGEILRV